jgi:hypothetical protein
VIPNFFILFGLSQAQGGLMMMTQPLRMRRDYGVGEKKEEELPLKSRLSVARELLVVAGLVVEKKPSRKD